MRLASFVLLSLFLFLLSSSVSAQYEEHLDVRVVQVPVTVWRGSEAVDGLTKDDFELYVNGERQAIDYFDAVDFETVSAPDPQLAAPPSLERRRLTMLVFDVLSSTHVQLLQAVRAVEKMVKEAPVGDYFGVAVYDGRSVRYVSPFTSDRAAVLRAVTTLRQSDSRDPLALSITAGERVAFAPSLFPSATGNVEGGFSSDLVSGIESFGESIERMGGVNSLAFTKFAAERDWQVLRHFAANAWLEAMASIADDLSSLQGIRQVALFSTGSPIANDASGDLRGQSASMSAVSPLRRRMTAMHEAYRRAGVTLHILDVAGLRAPGSASGSSVEANPRTAPEVFEAALGTGGRVIHDTGISNAARIFTTTRSVTYVLGFHPPSNGGERNAIEVKLKNQPPFTSLSYRRGYSRAADAQRTVSGMLLADTLLNDIPLNDVTMTLQADQHGTVDVGVPSNELLALAVEGFVTVDVYLYVFDESGSVVGWKQRRMRIDAARASSVLDGKELVRRERLSLPPGEYVARALVHVQERDLLSFRRHPFRVVAAVSAKPQGD